ncbi:hypothetical protein ACP70R_023261 [Stipagrostis hirtigluma subsp. patula]
MASKGASDDYSDEESLMDVQNNAHSLLVNGEKQVRSDGRWVCPFCPDNQANRWSMHNLTQHAEGLQNGTSKKGSEHRALLRFLLDHESMARYREEGEVGDCGGNEGVSIEKEYRSAARRARKDRRKMRKLQSVPFKCCGWHMLTGRRHDNDGSDGHAGGAGNGTHAGD